MRLANLLSPELLYSTRQTILSRTEPTMVFVSSCVMRVFNLVIGPVPDISPDLKINFFVHYFVEEVSKLQYMRILGDAIITIKTIIVRV